MQKPNSKHPFLTLDTQAFVDKLNASDSTPLYKLTPAQARQVLIDTQKGTPVKNPDVEIMDKTCETRTAGSVNVRCVKPKGATGNLPVIFYVHGGGWVMGNKDTHLHLICELACGSNAIVVYPEYTNAPEGQFPLPLEQCYGVLEQIAEKGAEYGADTSRIAIAGDSAGGCMATVLCMMSKERQGPKISFQLLLYPVTDAGYDTDSYDEFDDGPWLTKKAMKFFWDAYAPNKDDRKNPMCCPLQADKSQLQGLPPALVITDQNDVLRDEGEEYARRMIEAGVRVCNVRVNGTHHDFMMLNALADSAPAKTAILLSCAKLKKVFGCK